MKTFDPDTIYGREEYTPFIDLFDEMYHEEDRRGKKLRAGNSINHILLKNSIPFLVDNGYIILKSKPKIDEDDLDGTRCYELNPVMFVKFSVTQKAIDLYAFNEF